MTAPFPKEPDANLPSTSQLQSANEQSGSDSVVQLPTISTEDIITQDPSSDVQHQPSYPITVQPEPTNFCLPPKGVDDTAYRNIYHSTGIMTGGLVGGLGVSIMCCLYTHNPAASLICVPAGLLGILPGLALSEVTYQAAVAIRDCLFSDNARVVPEETTSLLQPPPAPSKCCLW